MTYNQIIKLLQTQGEGTKVKLLALFQKANIIDLIELRNSIQELINIKAVNEKNEI